jgi:hypothetical protein
VPNYVISEIKSKTGVEYDNYGNTVRQPMVEGAEGAVAASAEPRPNVVLNTKQGVFQRKRDTTVYRSTDNYKPQGNMVYDRHLLFDMSKKSGK